MNTINIWLEIGQKRTFASAAEWPGWARAGRDEDLALQALLKTGPRYAQVIQGTGLDFSAPQQVSAFAVTGRLAGNATTDFGAPSAIHESEKGAVDRQEMERLRTILQACWGAFDAAVRRANGKNLALGPRGGGRDLEKIMEHVLGGDQADLHRLAWKGKKLGETDLPGKISQVRREILQALDAAVGGTLPEQGPRGGKVWPVRYYARLAAWHTLDHAWEIEDQME